MRVLSIVCVIASFGCSSSTAPASSGDAATSDTSSTDEGAWPSETGGTGTSKCAPSTIVVRAAFPLPDGRTIRTAKITSAKVDHTASPSTLTATLEGGGTLNLRWKGDARVGLVSPYGAVTWGASESWCIDGDSEMRFTSATDVIFERFTVAEEAGLVADESFDRCHKPSDGGVPPPLPAIVQYEACVALPP